ncbi:DsrE family protein [Aquimarina hainanensis]|uniref:DsrE family protein n=1 Tax=Aquimarina hainanensis TaxID=1578017 RepID=A0ABW5NG46_9FLAO|nr:DsrE family protein [Aquimarina sp. TRL1]QKX06333.1 DsrE family protein [Aquimarina sp. TRL1]
MEQNKNSTHIDALFTSHYQFVILYIHSSHKYSIWTLCFLLSFTCMGQHSKQNNDIIKEYGSTYTVENPDFKTDLSQDFKAVFDVGRSFGAPAKVNPLINTAARFINMHYKAGVPLDKIKVALVIHGDAAFDVLNNTAYQKKYHIKNPNTPLIQLLSEQGVKIILCGQTAAYRNITKQQTLPQVQFALSAMTALVQLQNTNFRLINF